MPAANDVGESLGQRRCRGWSDGRSLRGLGHPFNLAFVFLRWGDHQAQCVPFDAKVERSLHCLELAIEADCRVGTIEVDSAAVDDEAVELGKLAGFLGSFG